MLKDAPPGQLAEAIRTVAAGEALLAPAVTKRMIEHFVSRPPADKARRERFAELTDRELEVLTLLDRGPLERARSGPSSSSARPTVKTHITRILQKVGVRDRVQAVVLAYESGLIEPGAAPVARGVGGCAQRLDAGARSPRRRRRDGKRRRR